MNEVGKKKRFSCLFGCLFIVLLGALLVSLVANGVMALGLMGDSGSGSREEGGEDEFPVLDETWSYGNGDTKVVRIPLYGVITREDGDGFFGGALNLVDSVEQQIRAAGADEDVRAIILEIDSPGGGITPTDELYQALLDFKAGDAERKVIAYFRGMAASGGYYVAMAADWIVAEPTSMIGSISVIMQTMNWSVLSEKVGVSDVTITSGEHKDLLNPFKAVDPAELAILQEMVDGLYTHFLNVVSTGRNMTVSEVRPYADGRVFLPQVALDAGLIDQVGYWKDVQAATAQLLGVEEVWVIRYELPSDLWDVLSGVNLDLSVASLVKEKTPQFMYLWNPVN